MEKKIKIAEREYALKFGMAEVLYLERELGLSPIKIAEAFGNAMFSVIAQVAYAMMGGEKSGIDIDLVFRHAVSGGQKKDGIAFVTASLWNDFYENPLPKNLTGETKAQKKK